MSSPGSVASRFVGQLLLVLLASSASGRVWIEGGTRWYPPGADAGERAALDALAEEIDGWLVYARPPDAARGEVVWMIDRVRIGGWRAETVAEGACARFGPAGERLAVFRPHDGVPGDGARGSIWVMDADGSHQRELVDEVVSRGVRGACPLDFHPDGRSVLIIRPDGGVDSVDIRTRRRRDLGLPHRFVEEIQASGDGRLLAGRWRGRGDWAMNRRMVVANLATGTQRVYGAGCCAAISPDGRWMTVNHDGHYRMSICHRDLRHRIVLRARDLIRPQHGWHNWHWSNHNDYLALASEVYRKLQRDFTGPPDAFVLQVTARRATRVTFGTHADFPDLFVSGVSRRGGRSFSPGEAGAVPYDLARVFRTRGETEPDPGPPRRIPRLVVKARLVRAASIDPGEARRHQELLVDHLFQVLRVRRGRLDAKMILVSRYAVQAGRTRSALLQPRPGQLVRLRIEPWHLHPELKGISRRILENGASPCPRRFVEVP